MIPRREIIAWREYAPWPTDLQVEQDLLLTRAMAAIFFDSFLASQVAMRGGTILHKVHLAPAARYSEDIDLVIVGDRPEDHIQKALKRVLAPVLGSPKTNVFADVVLAVRNLVKPSRVIRQVYSFSPTMAGQIEKQIKIEANCNERNPFYRVMDLDFMVPETLGFGPSVRLRSYDLDEMLGTKMRALLQRDQGRDLFDLWWAMVQEAPLVQPEPARIIKAFRHYLAQENTTVSFEDFSAELDRKIAIPAFRMDMDTLLRPGLPSFDVDVAAKFIRDNLLSLLKNPTSA